MGNRYLAFKELFMINEQKVNEEYDVVKVIIHAGPSGRMV